MLNIYFLFHMVMQYWPVKSKVFIQKGAQYIRIKAICIHILWTLVPL